MAGYDRPRLQVILGDRDVTERCDSLTFSATDDGGYEIATLGLPATDRPKKGAMVTIRSGLEVAWAGRVAEISDHAQHDRATKTTGCEGLIALLRDASYSMIYVDRDASHWGGSPSTTRQIALLSASQTLAGSSVAGDVTNGLPSLMQEIDGQWAAPNAPLCEAWYDAGALNLIAKIYYNALASGPVLLTTDTVSVSPDDVPSSSQSSANLYSVSGAAGYFAPPTPQRYGRISKLAAVGPAGVDGAKYLTAWRTPAVYGPHGLTLRGPDPGGVFCSDVVRHALGYAPGISAGMIVDSTGLIVPHLSYPTPTTADVVISAMAKLMGWCWGVWEPATALGTTPRLDFRPPPGDATAVVMKAECDQLDVTSRLGDLYDVAQVAYSDPAGIAQIATVSLPNPGLDEAGIPTRTLQLSMGVSTAAAASTFGLYALKLSQSSARAAGQATLPASVRLPGGGSKPAHLLRPGIDRLRIIDLVDGGPMMDIGTVRRDVFRISRIETTVAADGVPSTRVELDNGMNLLEVLQARLSTQVGFGATGG